MSDNTPPDLIPYLHRCVRELRESMRPALSERESWRLRHNLSIWYRQLELCLQDLRAEGNFRGDPATRRALHDLQEYYEYRQQRADADQETVNFESPNEETDNLHAKRFKKALKRLDMAMAAEEKKTSATTTADEDFQGVKSLCALWEPVFGSYKRFIAALDKSNVLQRPHPRRREVHVPQFLRWLNNIKAKAGSSGFDPKDRSTWTEEAWEAMASQFDERNNIMAEIRAEKKQRTVE